MKFCGGILNLAIFCEKKKNRIQMALKAYQIWVARNLLVAMTGYLVVTRPAIFSWFEATLEITFLCKYYQLRRRGEFKLLVISAEILFNI